ncbi:MAG: hypothetical protein CR988_04125 [Treponema sp.]|nr:MAG: hypothetical protein CR988_04125 [Treponema sp.]
MTKSSIKESIYEAIKAGKRRDYKTAIRILEDLVAAGFAEVQSTPISSGGEKHPEIYLYLSRAWNAAKQPVRAIVFGKAYVSRCADDPAGWFFLGRAYLANEDYTKAAATFEKSLRIRPNNIEAMSMLGMSYLKGKQSKQAREIFEKALKIDPDNKRLNNGYMNALFVESIHLFKAGNFEIARQMLTFAINNGVDGVVPRLYLAHILRSMKAIPEALSQYNAAISFAPDDPALQWYPAAMMLEMGDMQGAIEKLAKVGFQIEDKSLSEQFLAMGVVRQHIKNGEWARAIEAGRLYTKAFGSTVEIHLLLAEAQKKIGKTDLALNHYNRALEIEPANRHIYYAVFDLLQEKFMWDSLQKAIVTAEKANCCEPKDLYYYKVITAAHIDNPAEEVLPHLQAFVKTEEHAANYLIYNAIGICYIKLGMPELAVNWYKKTININQNDEEANIGLIACYEALTEYDELYKTYNNYLSNWTDNLSIRMDFAEFLKTTNRWQDLCKQLETIAVQAKKNLDLDIAVAYRKSGDFRKAAILYRKMLRQKPEEKVLLHGLVYCLDKMGQITPAINLLQAARKTFGEKNDSMIIEGILCLRAKKRDDAIRLFQYVAEKEPENKIAAEYLTQALNRV